MKFLVIGASGFIGRALLAHAASLGHVVMGTQARSRQPGLVVFDLLKDRIADCVDRSFFEGESPVHAVICSAISDMDRCLAEREMAYRVNVENTIRLIEDITALNARPVFLSTCYVFDGRQGYYAEDHPLAPANEYGRQKLEVEERLCNLAPPAFVARVNKAVGDNPREPHLFCEWHKLVIENQPIVCIERNLLSPTSVQDIAQAIVLGCQLGLTGVFHISNPEFFYRDELARQFCYALGKAPNVVNKPLKEFHFADNRSLNSYLDGSKFRRTTGMQFTSMREVMRSFIRQLPAAGSV